MQQRGWSFSAWYKYSNLDLWRLLHLALQRAPRPWHIVKVSNHQNWKTAPDEYHAWLWYHNDAAREKAHCAMQTMRAQQKAVYQLQLGVANCFCQVKRAKHISETASVPEDMLQLKMQALGMMLCDAGIKFPGSDCEPVWQRFLLCAPFGQLLFEWFRSVEWVWDPGGFSLLEMYYAFTGQTGWLVPLNLAAWSDEVRPGGCRGVNVKALWVHETQYPQLVLHRQALTSQFVTFAHVVRALFLVIANAIGISRTCQP